MDAVNVVFLPAAEIRGHLFSSPVRQLFVVCVFLNPRVSRLTLDTKQRAPQCRGQFPLLVDGIAYGFLSCELAYNLVQEAVHLRRDQLPISARKHAAYLSCLMTGNNPWMFSHQRNIQGMTTQRNVQAGQHG